MNYVMDQTSKNSVTGVKINIYYYYIIIMNIIMNFVEYMSGIFGTISLSFSVINHSNQSN